MGNIHFISHSNSFWNQKVSLAHFSNPVEILLCMSSFMKDIIKKIFTFYKIWSSLGGGRDGDGGHFEKKYKVSNRFESEYELIMKMRDKMIECVWDNSQEKGISQNYRYVCLEVGGVSKTKPLCHMVSLKWGWVYKWGNNGSWKPFLREEVWGMGEQQRKMKWTEKQAMCPLEQ